MPYHPRAISSLGPKGPLDDMAYDTDFAMYYSLYINGNTYKIFCLFLFISEILLYIPFRSITEL